MKKIIGISMVALMMILSGCSIPTKSELKDSKQHVNVKGEKPTIKIFRSG
ncbi:RGD-containing lipoprotein [Staphylococcus gallinarum]|uniref:RGD-containing lipoprotein n=1 Tax=Staphylococcus gallinarum TaxID=1293 RepID=A0A380FAL6_STAGA|nr:RGD-containing lipoprotein [Staphylococcus gallinarum]